MIKHSLLIFWLTAFAFPLHAQEIKWDKTDLGPFHTGCFKVKNQLTAKGIAVKVGDRDNPATILFDPELLRVSAAWKGGFIKFPRGRGGLEGQIGADGEVIFSTPYLPGWSAGEFTQDPRDRHQGHLHNTEVGPGIKVRGAPGGIFSNDGRIATFWYDE